MARTFFLTALSSKKENQMNYFFDKHDGKTYFCNALTSAEASAKNILSKYNIDEIIAIGGSSTVDDTEDKVEEIQLDRGFDFYTADINELSGYSLFRYRIAQYIQDIQIDEIELLNQISEEEQAELRNFLKNYFQNNFHSEKTTIRYNRFFKELVLNQSEFDALLLELERTLLKEKGVNDIKKYSSWILAYLYSCLKDGNKMEAREDNENLKICFIPTRVSENHPYPINNINQIMDKLIGDGKEETILYIDSHDENETDSFILMNILSMFNRKEYSNIKIEKIITVQKKDGILAHMISDETKGYQITNLISGINAFVQYGKADQIIDYWTHCHGKSEYIQNMVYAMRNVDSGISLCDVEEIEKGISKLQVLFQNQPDQDSLDYESKLIFMMFQEIKKSYGPLIEKNTIELIDLARWIYSKKLYQQTLTLIESRLPDELFAKGIYNYCMTEEQRENALEAFALAHYECPTHQKYMFGYLPHYFVKFYGRDQFYAKANPKYKDRLYAKFKVDQLDQKNKDLIPAFSRCPDKQALEDLLFAFYYVGTVRNTINHANDLSDEDKDSILLRDETDESVKMQIVSESILYFLKCYDKVLSLLPDEEFTPLEITSSEVWAKSNQYRKEKRYNKDREKDRKRNDSENK